MKRIVLTKRAEAVWLRIAWTAGAVFGFILLPLVWLGIIEVKDD